MWGRKEGGRERRKGGGKYTGSNCEGGEEKAI